MKKYTRADGPAEVLTPEQTKAMEDELHKLAKTSARDLSDLDRAKIQSALDKSTSD